MGNDSDQAAASQRLRFAAFEADLGTGELWRDDELVALGGKPFEVLAVLLSRPGELVERRELRRALWPAAAAIDGDKSLNAAVKTLRRALGDSAGQPHLVETLRGRGYRLLVEVEPADSDPVRHLRRRRHKTARGRLWLSAGLVLLALIPGLLLVQRTYHQGDGSAGPLRLAVLHLVTAPDAAGGSLLGAALTEELTTRLGNLAAHDLVVVGRASLGAAQVQPADALGVADLLDADLLVEGSVVGGVDGAAAPLRLHLRLVDVASQTQLWASGIDQGADAVPQLLTGIEAALLHHLGKTAEEGPAGTASSLPAGPAQQLYLRALMTAQQRTWQAVAEAQEMAAQAAAMEPGLVAAHLLVARLAWQRWLGRQADRDQALQAAEKAVARALELAPDQAEAHALRAEIRLRRYLDWQGAAADYERALSVAPADSELRHRHAWFLLAAGRHRAARQEMALALELDPLSAKLHSDLGWFHYRAGDFSGALAHCFGALELDAGMAPAAECRFRALAHLGRYAEARQEALSAVAVFDPPPPLLDAVAEAAPEPGYRQLFAWYADRRFTLIGPMIAAMDAATLGDNERALTLLEQALQERDPYLVLIAVTPELQPLADEPRYQAVLTAVRDGARTGR